MRKLLTVFSLGSCLLVTVAGAQTPPDTQKDKASTAAQPSTAATAAQPPTNACYLWKGRGGASGTGYMASFAICRPWNANYGWHLAQKNSRGEYYYGTYKDVHITSGSWAVYADFSSAVVSTKAEYDVFVADTKLAGSCGECLR